MARSFVLSCESTVDLPYSYVADRDISVIFYSYLQGGVSYEDSMSRDAADTKRFYDGLRSGVLASTTQINPFVYEEYFESLLEKGDVLHIVFSSGLTKSVNNAEAAAKAVMERYPGRRIILVDSLCASGGYGLLVDSAADLRDEGRSIEEVAAWVEQNRKRVHHLFFSADLSFFKISGRLSGPAAALATVLNICPLMHVDTAGHIVATEKIRGKKNAIKAFTDFMEQHATDGKDYRGKCFLNHSDNLADAELMIASLEERFPQLKGRIFLTEIGTIIASHTGPGTVSFYFFGDERTDQYKLK